MGVPVGRIVSRMVVQEVGIGVVVHHGPRVQVVPDMSVPWPIRR